MTERVAFAWWPPANGGSQQAFVSNYNGLVGAGFEVVVFNSMSLGRMLDAAPSVDWAFVPFVFYPDFVEALAEETHVHLQVGGYGRDDWDAAERAIDAADTVSVLDPQLADRFGCPGAPWVPNPPNFRMFHAQPVPPDGYVLVPKQVAGGGLGGCREVAESHPDERFVVLGSSFPDPPENVTIRPKAPLSWMPEAYAGAKAVVNPVEREGLPNTAYEAFLTATPYVFLYDEGIGRTQAVTEPLVWQAGEPCDKVNALVHAGHHWTRDLDDALDHPVIGESGRQWAETWGEAGWGWAEKMETVAGVVSNRQRPVQ